MATLRPHSRDLAPLRLSVERALVLAALVAGALAPGGSAIAGERYQHCSASERATYGLRKQPEMQPIERPPIKGARWPHEVHGGRVNLLLSLRVDGRVHSVCVLHGLPPDAYEQIAVDSARQWRYSPADVAKLRRNDRRLRVEMTFETGD